MKATRLRARACLATLFNKCLSARKLARWKPLSVAVTGKLMCDHKLKEGKMSKTSDDAEKIDWWTWLLFLFRVLVVWVGYWGIVWVGYRWILWISECFPELEKVQFGDVFGALNALFAGLAFAGVIWAIILQKKELALQREELAGQKEQLEAQNQTLQKQNFESSFFQLLGLHNDIVNSMTYDNSHQGRECFDYLLGVFRYNYYDVAAEDYHAGMAGSPDKARQVRLQWINDNYEKFFDKYQSRVGHYFRNLYNVVKFVDEKSDILKDHKAKKFYTNLIRAQLSSYELGLLFYNCLSERRDKFQKLVVKYALLKDMDFKVLIHEEHKSLYDKSAYGESK